MNSFSKSQLFIYSEAERQMNQEIMDISQAIKSAVQAERIYLFGSNAYGTPGNDSDIDLFIVIPDVGIKPLEAIRQARFALIPLKRKTSVDILADYRSRFELRRKLNTLERKIANEGILLYERT
jgi:predicted nucleotidyltransferase